MSLKSSLLCVTGVHMGRLIWQVLADWHTRPISVPSGLCVPPRYRRITFCVHFRAGQTASWWAGDMSATAITCMVIT